MINPISTAVSGLTAASRKLAVATENIVNASSVGSLDPNSPNQAYAAQTTLAKSVGGGGVQTVTLTREPPFVPSFQPDSPFANEDGLVNAPNVNLDEELVNTKLAEQAYKANAQVIRTTSDMQDVLVRALDQET
ncbi:MAG: flagellar basal body rod C-terminal domain-containing protein [Pseudobdellovibrionaceae bacterium]